MKRACIMVLLLASTAACGDEAATPVGCEWFTGPSNCILPVLADIQSCRPDTSASGAWNADNTACTYPDGTTVEFTSAVPADAFDADYMIDFTMKGPSGDVCMSFTEGANGLTVTSAAGTYMDGTEGGSLESIDISCPDGLTYRATTTEVLSCLFSLNGHTSSGSGGGSIYSFGLLAQGESTEVFSCR